MVDIKCDQCELVAISKDDLNAHFSLKHEARKDMKTHDTDKTVETISENLNENNKQEEY